MELRWQGSAQPCKALLTLNLAVPGLLRRGGDFLHEAFFWQPRGAQTLPGKAGHTHTGPHTEPKGPASAPAPPAGTAWPPACLRAKLPSHTPTFSARGQGGSTAAESRQPAVTAGKRETARLPGERMLMGLGSSGNAFPHHSHFPKRPTAAAAAHLSSCHRGRVVLEARHAAGRTAALPPCSTPLAQPTTATAPLATPLTHGTRQAVTAAPQDLPVCYGSACATARSPQRLSALVRASWAPSPASRHVYLSQPLRERALTRPPCGSQAEKHTQHQ